MENSSSYLSSDSGLSEKERDIKCKAQKGGKLNAKREYNEKDTKLKGDNEKTKKEDDWLENDLFNSSDMLSARGTHKVKDRSYNPVQDARAYHILFKAVMKSFRRPNKQLCLFNKELRKVYIAMIPGCKNASFVATPRVVTAPRGYGCCAFGKNKPIRDDGIMDISYVRIQLADGTWCSVDAYDPSLNDWLFQNGISTTSVKRDPPERKVKVMG
jgi:hypothetical protein